MNKEEVLEKIRLALNELQKQKPFVGIPSKDYYRGQSDALYWVVEELLEPEESNE